MEYKSLVFPTTNQIWLKNLYNLSKIFNKQKETKRHQPKQKARQLNHLQNPVDSYLDLLFLKIKNSYCLFTATRKDKNRRKFKILWAANLLVDSALQETDWAYNNNKINNKIVFNRLIISLITTISLQMKKAKN